MQSASFRIPLRILPAHESHLKPQGSYPNMNFDPPTKKQEKTLKTTLQKHTLKFNQVKTEDTHAKLILPRNNLDVHAATTFGQILRV